MEAPKSCTSPTYIGNLGQFVRGISAIDRRTAHVLKNAQNLLVTHPSCQAEEWYENIKVTTDMLQGHVNQRIKLQVLFSKLKSTKIELNFFRQYLLCYPDNADIIKNIKNLENILEDEKRQLAPNFAFKQALKEDIKKTTDWLNEQCTSVEKSSNKRSRLETAVALSDTRPTKKRHVQVEFENSVQIPIELQDLISSYLPFKEHIQNYSDKVTRLNINFNFQYGPIGEGVARGYLSWEESMNQVLLVCDQFLNGMSLKQGFSLLKIEVFIAELYENLRSSKGLGQLIDEQKTALFNSSNLDDQTRKEILVKYWPFLAILRYFEHCASTENKEWLDDTTTLFAKFYYNWWDKVIIQDPCFVLISPFETINKYMECNCKFVEDNADTYTFEPSSVIIKELVRRGQYLEVEEREKIYQLFTNIGNRISSHETDLELFGLESTIEKFINPNPCAREDFVCKTATTSLKFYRPVIASNFSCPAATYAIIAYNLFIGGDYATTLQVLNKAFDRQEAPHKDMTAKQEVCPFWTPLILSFTHYHLKNYAIAKASFEEFLKGLPADHQELKNCEIVETYQILLNNLISKDRQKSVKEEGVEEEEDNN